MIEEKALEISGFKKAINFEIYDGYAYCPDYKGHEYGIEYPRIELIEKSKELQGDIREWVGLKEDAEITVFDIIQTFNVMYRDGAKVVYDSKEKTWVETK
jgi:hypothetical protein